MPTLTDDYWGLALESTYGTYQAPTRFYPWLKVKAGIDNDKRTSEGMIGGGGRRAKLGSRTLVPAYGGVGKLTTTVELESKGLGRLLDFALGSSTVTAITGGSQMVFHDGISGSLLPSASIQVGQVQNDGTMYVLTYTGATASKVTIEQAVQKIPTMTVEWVCKAPVNNIAAVVPSYPSGSRLFDFGLASASLGTALTPPTTTALGTGLTAFSDVKSWKLVLDQGLDAERYVLGGRNRPLAQGPEVTFEAEIEWNAATLANYVLNGDAVAFETTWSTTETLGAGVTQLQLSIPQMSLTGDLPEVETGKTRVQSIKADITNNGVDQDLYLAYRSTDVAL